jgi:hypothetical protein
VSMEWSRLLYLCIQLRADRMHVAGLARAIGRSGAPGRRSRRRTVRLRHTPRSPCRSAVADESQFPQFAGPG